MAWSPLSVPELLVKYPARVFEQGILVWQHAGWLRVLAPLTLILIAVTVVSYVRAGRAGRLDRIILATVRSLALILVALCLLRPALLVSTSLPQQNILGIVLDDSKSMQIRDADPGTRLELIQRLFGDSSGSLVPKLAERFALRFYRFSETLERIDNPASLRGSGSRTDLAAALDDTRRDFAGAPLAGLIVVTDGADNAGQAIGDAVLGLQAAKIPVYTVGVGAERFARDVAVDRIELPHSTLKGAVLVGSVAIRARGLAGTTLALVVEDGSKIVANQDVVVPRGTDVVTVPIRVPPLEAGARDIRVSVRPVEGEILSQNNSLSARVEVRDRREKILYVEGGIRPEFAFLRRAAQSDSNLQVVGLQRTAKEKYLRLGVDDSLELINGFPTTRAELFRYRALILGSIEAAAFTPDQLRMIGEYVSDRGGSLLALGGRAALGEGAFEGTALADALPLTFVNRTVDSAENPVELQIRPTPAGFGNAALLLAESPDANRNRWDSLPVLTSVNRTTGLKPGATALLDGRTNDGETVPVLAWHRYGRGRALAFPVQDSWLWQMHASIPVEDQTHETLWRQLLRWMLEEVPDRSDLAFSSNYPAPGERVTMQLELTDSAFQRVNDAQVAVEVVAPDGSVRSVPLEWTLGRDGQYAGTFVPTDEGEYLISGQAIFGTDTVRLATTSLGVADRGVDFVNAEMRSAVLQRIARETGGRFYTAATVGSLPDDVVFTESGVTVREAMDLWDMPIVLIALIGLLGFEWVYRRYRGLI